jgi:FAD synthase
MDLYGEEIEIVTLYKIRENIKFKSINDLKQQIKKDIKKIRKTIDYVITF